jgi:hypothetical protein
MKSLLSLLLIFPVLAFADDVVPNVLPPDIIVQLLVFLQSVPYIGPVLVMILKAIAIITPVMTALSICAEAVLSVPEVMARFQGAHDLADKIKYWSDKIIYWLSYLSIRNAQKPKV